jgi:CRP/FNR family transcriptional regulator
MDVEAYLSRSEFFNGITPKSLRSLAEICVPKRIKKRESLFLEGQQASSIYLLVTGSVQLFKNSADGREIVIKVVRPGEIFGEVVLFETREFPVNAAALSDGLVLALPKAQILCLLENEGFRNDFIAMLMKKQRYLTERILHLTLHDVEERFLGFLQEQGGKSQKYHITLSKKAIASAIATTPETLSRLILRMRSEGTLEWEGQTLALREGFWEARDSLD